MADANTKAQAASLREMSLKLQAQADTLDPPPPTDSRQRGFNAEVDASHAAAAEALRAAQAAAAPAAPAPATAAAPRGVAAVVADAIEVINSLLGNVNPLATLIDELRSL